MKLVSITIHLLLLYLSCDTSSEFSSPPSAVDKLNLSETANKINVSPEQEEQRHVSIIIVDGQDYEF